MFEQASEHYAKILEQIRQGGLWKEERLIASPQGADIVVAGKNVVNFCANNYLGLANHPKIVAAAKAMLDRRGYGLSSVRFICGTQDIHQELEIKLSQFVGLEQTILYSSCFDANGGLFETLLDEADAVISDALNHASIIDGIRLCKAQRYRFEHDNMIDLEEKLKASQKQRLRLIATDGVFSMDGDVARLDAICDLAEKYSAMVMVDDSHATGFLGQGGRGTHEYRGVMGRIDILSSTLGKALGGASGGFVSARAQIVDLLRNRSRPYLFSNTLAPPIVAGTLAALELIQSDPTPRQRLMDNTRKFRQMMTAAGFQLRPGEHPIVPIMLGEAAVASEFARRALEEGIYVMGFSYPVVPQGKARVRVQISAAHSDAQIERAVEVFGRLGQAVGAVK